MRLANYTDVQSLMWHVKKKTHISLFRICRPSIWTSRITFAFFFLFSLVCNLEQLISWTSGRHPAVSGWIQSEKAELVRHQQANQLHFQPCCSLVEFILGNQALISLIIDDYVVVINGICSLHIIMHHLQRCMTVMGRKKITDLWKQQQV